MCYDSSILKTGLSKGYLSSMVGTINPNVSKNSKIMGSYLSYIEAKFHKFKCNVSGAMAKCVKEQWLRQGHTYACSSGSDSLSKPCGGS